MRQHLYIITFFILFSIILIFYYQYSMNNKLHYYMSAHPECIPSNESKTIFNNLNIGQQVAIIKGCAIRNAGAYQIKTLIEGEP